MLAVLSICVAAVIIATAVTHGQLVSGLLFGAPLFIFGVLRLKSRQGRSELQMGSHSTQALISTNNQSELPNTPVREFVLASLHTTHPIKNGQWWLTVESFENPENRRPLPSLFYVLFIGAEETILSYFAAQKVTYSLRPEDVTQSHELVSAGSDFKINPSQWEPKRCEIVFNTAGNDVIAIKTPVGDMQVIRSSGRCL